MIETLGHYKILDRIGAGGMGDVYRGRDMRLGRTVAIKVLAPDVRSDADRRERFLREARAAAALSHPNIAALYEIGEDQGELFLVFEFVPGDTLQQVVAGRPLNPRRAIDFAIQVADALAEAHAAGIVHRDIKPANIIITPKDKAKVLDFGLATWTSGGSEREAAAHTQTMMATAAGTTLGTVAYMSPEQALGHRVDGRTDIFSLGIVLYEMLTGARPFSGATATAVALQIVQSPAPTVSSANRSVPPELDRIVARALAKNADERYESAAILAAELHAVGVLLDARSDAAPLPRSTGRKFAGGSRWFGAFAFLAAVAAAGWYSRYTIERAWRRTIGRAPAPVVAVIPFDTAADQIFFADGLAEDLITRLGQTPGLKVIGRSATRTYRGRTPRDVARDTGAAVILTGSVRPAGDAVKVSLELVSPADEVAIWSSQYTRNVKDIFGVQAQVAEEVAAALRLKLLPTASSARAASRTVDPWAYELYARGRQAIAERRMADAIGLYERAIAIDAGIAEAFAGIAEALEFDTIAGGVPLDAARRQRQKTAAERAYQLDPDLPQANLAMGLAAPALRDTLGYLRRAIDADPSYGEGLHQIADQIVDFDPALAIRFYRASLAADAGLEAGHTDIALALAALDRAGEGHTEIDRVRVEPVPGWRDAFHVTLDLEERRPDRALERLDATGMPADMRRALRVRALAASGNYRDALSAAVSSGRPRKDDPCVLRATVAALYRDTGARRTARDLAGPLVDAARTEAAEADAMRCGVFAAAALDDAAAAAALLERIAGREEWLRYWALQILTDRGSLVLRGRVYPWTRIVGTPPMMAARQQLDAAYAREREVARSVLNGLP